MKIGIDLGGTKTESILIDDKGNEIFRKRIQTEKNYEGTIKGITSLVKEIEQKFNQVNSIGIGMPGIVSKYTSLVKNANSTWLIGHKLDQDLTNILRRPVKIANDANCFAMSEAFDGAAAGHKVVFAAILGTGVGGGICIDQTILTGLNSICGEWGHNPLPWPCDSEDVDELEGISCYCGRRSCIETFLSGEGLRRSYAELSGKKIQYAPSPAEIYKISRQGGTIANQVLELYASRLAKSLATVINIIDPSIIVLGGGLSNIEFLYQRVPQLWSQWIFSDKTKTKLLKNQNGDSSGVLGAARLWSEPDK